MTQKEAEASPIQAWQQATLDCSRHPLKDFLHIKPPLGMLVEGLFFAAPLLKTKQKPSEAKHVSDQSHPLWNT